MYGSFSARVFRLSALTLVLVSGATVGCNEDSPNRSQHSFRNDLAAIRSVHGDSDGIGAMDATAPPVDLTQYRRPSAGAAKSKPGI